MVFKKKLEQLSSYVKKSFLKLSENKIYVTISLILLALPLVIYHMSFFDDGKRSWYYYDWTDACQMVAAQSVAQALGAPIEVVVWPGATLSTVYLYKSIAIPLKQENTDKIQTAINYVSESVFFHWQLSFLYGLIFLWLLFFLVYKLTNSSLLALGTSGVIAINPWYASQVTAIRPEMLSLIFLFAAALVVIKGWYKRSYRNKSASILFGFFLAMAIFTKLQTAPIIIVLIVLFLINNIADISSEDIRSFRTDWLNALIVVVALMVSFGFLKTELIIGASYSLAKSPNVAGNIAFLMSILLVIASIYFASYGKYGQLANLFFRIFYIVTGGLLALFFVTLPNLLLGGFYSFIASINRILFGTVSYAKYGEIWAGYEGWNNNTRLIEKVKGFLSFQNTSEIFFLNGGNLALLVISAMLITYLVYYILCHISKQISQSSGSEKKAGYLLYLPLLFLSAALLFDFTATFRKPGGSPYQFYHIYSLPFYLIAISTGLSLIFTKINEIYKFKKNKLVKLIAFVFLSGILIHYPLISPKITSWKEDQAAVERSLGNIRNMSAVPSFFSLQGITQEQFITKLTFPVEENKVLASMLTMSGLTDFRPAECVDKNTATSCWHTDKSSSGAWLKIDLGSDKTEAYTEIWVYALVQGYAGNYSIQYSDDDKNYKNAFTGFIPSQIGWNKTKWENIGKYRYWRLLLTNTPGRGAWLTEFVIK